MWAASGVLRTTDIHMERSCSQLCMFVQRFVSEQFMQSACNTATLMRPPWKMHQNVLCASTENSTENNNKEPNWLQTKFKKRVGAETRMQGCNVCCLVCCLVVCLEMPLATVPKSLSHSVSAYAPLCVYWSATDNNSTPSMTAKTH